MEVLARAEARVGLPDMYYKALGWAVWKGGTWYLRRRYGTAPKKIGAGALAAAGVAVAIAVAGKRLGDRSGA